MEGKLDELGGDIIIMKDKQESEERKAKEVQKEQANQLARRPSILGRLRSGSVTAVSGEDAAAEALRAVTEQLTIVKTKKNPLVRLKNLLGYCVAAQGPAEVRAFSAQMSNLALTCVLLLYAFSYGNVISQLEVLVLSASILLTTVFTYLNAHKRTLKRCNLALAALVWQMSMDASVLKDAIEEVGKHYSFCRLDLKSLDSSRCDLRQMHAAYKASFGLVTAMVAMYTFYLVCTCRDECEAERTAREVKDKLISKISASPRKSVMKRFSISGKGNAPAPMRRMSLVAADNSA